MNRLRILVINALLILVVSSTSLSQRRAEKERPSPSPATETKRSKSREYGSLIISANRFFIVSPNILRFFDDPVGTLKLEGAEVPPSTEQFWKDLAVALRRLAHPPVIGSIYGPWPGFPDGHKTEIAYIQLGSGSVIPLIGELRGSRDIGTRFLADPVETLRALGLNVQPKDESAWKEFAYAFNALRQAYLKETQTAKLQ